MSSSRRSGRHRLRLVLLVLTAVTLISLDFREFGLLDTARHRVASALSPAQGAVDWVTAPLSDTWNGIVNYGDLEAENEALRAQVDELVGLGARNADAAVQFEQLLEQVDIPWVGSVGTATARVVRRPATSFSHEIVIDKGADAGIRVGMPVVTGAGLIGQVVEAAADRAWVRLLTAPDFRVGVRFVTSQRVGTASGQGPGNQMRVDTGIEPGEPDARIPEGEIVTTSGIDERSSYPASIPVGRVVRTEQSNGGLTVEAFVEPLADLDQFSFVNVLLITPLS